MTRLLLCLALALSPAASTACSDPNCIDAAGKARLIQSARDHLVDMQQAEETLRTLNDPHSRAGRARLREAAILRDGAEQRLKTITELLAKPQPGCRD